MSLLGLGLAAARGPKEESWEDIYQREFSAEGAPSVYKGTAPVSGFLDLISRSGWSLRSAMAGDFAAAGKHLAMIANDIPFGWIDRKFSFMGLVAPDDWRYPGSYDWTTQKEKYEFSDVLERWGVQTLPTKGSWGRFGIDVVGGVIDPLSLIGSPAGGLARGALKNTTTSMGREMLKGALKTGRTGRSNLLTTFGENAEDLDDILIHALTNKQSLSDEAIASLKNEAAWSRAAEEEYAKRAFGFAEEIPVELGDEIRGLKGSYFWESRSSQEMKEATEWLIENGDIDAAGGISIGLPWRDPITVLHPIDRVSRYLRNTTTFNNAHFHGLREMGGTVSNYVGSLWNRTRGLKYMHLVPGAARQEALRLKGQIKMYDSFVRDDILLSFTEDLEIMQIAGRSNNPRFWDQLPDDKKHVMNLMEELPPLVHPELGDVLKHKDTASTRFRKSFIPFFVSQASMPFGKARDLAHKIKGSAAKALRGGEDYTLKAIEGIRDSDLLFKSPFKVVEGPALDKNNISIFENLIVNGGNLEEGSDAWRALKDRVDRPLPFSEYSIAASHIGRGVTQPSFEKDLFKFVEEELPRHFLAKNLRRKLGATPTQNWPGQLVSSLGGEPALNEVLTGINAMEFGGLYNLLKLARDHSLDSMKDNKLGRKVSQISALKNGEYKLTIPEVAHKRLLSDNRKRAVREASLYTGKIAKGASPDVDPESLNNFFGEMLGEITFDRGVLRKILAGGSFSLGMASSATPFELIAKPGETINFIQRKVLADGSIENSLYWPGLNKFYKPFLTSHPLNMPYHFGNAMGSIFMLASDERVGWSGVGTVLGSLGGLLGITDSSKVMATYVKALHMDPRKAFMGIREVGMLNPAEKVGKTGMTHVEFIEAARNFLGGGMSMDASDLMASMGDTMEVLGQYGKVPLRGWYNPFSETWRKGGENMSNFMESHLRLKGFKKLIEGGMAPKLAGPKVQELLVDYSVQSSTDQWLRDIFPFIRFRLASLAWTRATLTRPRKLMLPAVTQRAADIPETPRDPSRPPSGWDALDIGIPGYRIPTRAGAEATLSSFGLFGLEPSGRRGLLSELHPIIEFGMEQTLERELWSGKRFASDTRARGIEKLIGTEGVSRWGANRLEIDGLLKKVLSSSPISRQLGSINKIWEAAEDKTFGAGTLGRVIFGIKQAKKDALQDLHNKLKVELQDKVASGDLYTFQKLLSSKPTELTLPSTKRALDDYAATARAFRDRGLLKEQGTRGQ